MSSDIRTVTLIPGDGIGNYEMKAFLLKNEIMKIFA